VQSKVSLSLSILCGQIALQVKNMYR